MIRPLLADLQSTLAGAGEALGVVVATPAGERHESGALLVAAAAAVEGRRVIYLGPHLPADEIARAALRAPERGGG